LRGYITCFACSGESIRVKGTFMSFYRRWIVACTAGELVGIGTAAGAALAINALFGEPQSFGSRLATLVTFAAVGAVEGTALASFQWRVLRARLPRLRAGEWVGVTVALAVAGWIVGMTPSLFINHDATAQEEPGLAVVLLMAAMAGAGAGLFFGAAQWFVLRRHAEEAGKWIWIHVPAWALAMSAIFLGASLPTAGSPGWFIALTGALGGVLGGLLLGAITGLVAKNLRPWVDEQHWSLQGKVCAVTGANSGIGQEIAVGLARLGGSVLLLCRRPAEGERVRQFILAQHPGADVSVVPCDVGDFGSVHRAAAQILDEAPRLDVLVHNAGTTFPHRRITADGVEATLAVDVVGPFLLTTLLRQRLESCGGRVITLTGISQRKGHVDPNDLHFARRSYDWLAANNQAQRGRWLFMSELTRRAPALMTAAVHPGAVLTGAQARLPRLVRALIHTLARPAFVRPEVGAIPVLRLAAHPDLLHQTGRYFDRCHLAPDVADPALAQTFWAACEDMTGEHGPGESAGTARSFGELARTG
jgi:NAD(P)-dependent dehydrogenase (short-subunit alcohol dehydrogenase family)